MDSSPTDPGKFMSPQPSHTSSTIDFASLPQRTHSPTAPPIDGLLTLPGADSSGSDESRTKPSSYHRRNRTPYPDTEHSDSEDDSRPSTPRDNARIFDTEPNWPTGWRPYGCLIGCFLLMWNSWGIVNAYGTYQSYYSQHLFASSPLMLLNLIGSTQSFVVLTFSFIVGRLLDANYARYLIALGTVLVTLGHFLLSVVNGDGGRNEGNYGATWATQGLLVGLGQACFFVSSSQVASTWFIKRKAVAIGIVASGASVAGLVYPIMVKFLITEVGYNNAVRYNATLIGVTAIASFLLAVPNPAHNYRKPQKWFRTSVWIDSHAFRNPAFTWFTASICFVFFGFYAVFFNLEDWAAYHGFGQKDVPPGFKVDLGDQEVQNEAIRTFWLLCIMNVSSTAGRLFSACFAERFGALNIHFLTTTLASLLLLILWTLTETLAPALAFVIIFGALSGSVIGLPPASIAHILGRSDISQQAKLGQWTGMMYTTSAPFALTGPVIAGFLINQYGPNNYLTVQLWSGFCLFCAAICMLMARYYSGPSRTVDMIRALSGSFSRSNTLDGATGEKVGVLAGLGRKMRAGSAQSEGPQAEAGAEESGVVSPAVRGRSPVREI